MNFKKRLCAQFVNSVKCQDNANSVFIFVALLLKDTSRFASRLYIVHLYISHSVIQTKWTVNCAVTFFVWLKIKFICGWLIDGWFDWFSCCRCCCCACACGCCLRSLPQANRLYARLSVHLSLLLSVSPSVCLACALCLTHLKFIC